MKEIFCDRVSILKLGMVNPLPEKLLLDFAKGNMKLGNDKDFLVRVVSQCLPYIGYPRSLNAVSCIQKAAEA